MQRSGIRVGAVQILALALLASALPAAAQDSSPGAADGEFDALAAVELMNLAPPGILETCVPSTPAMDGLVATANCAYGDATVVYGRFIDAPSLEAAYELIAHGSGAVPDTGTACAEGAFEGAYTGTDGSAAGRLMCLFGADGYVAMWTDSGHTALGIVLLDNESDFEILDGAWSAARLDSGGASVTAQASEPPADGSVAQWAISAIASTQYADSSWSATQATGPPDTTAYGDYPTAWAPSGSDVGVQSIELTYQTPVIPTKIVIWETGGSGFVTGIDAWDGTTDTWVTLWEGVDDSPDERTGFEPPLSPTDLATNRVRITIDTDVPGWNEIDAVELVGVPAAP